MQRGSAGAMRGITPRLVGVGWVASFAGFIIALVYNTLLGLSLYYLMVGGSEPWKDYQRPISCDTASLASVPNAEIYLYEHVTMLL